MNPWTGWRSRAAALQFSLLPILAGCFLFMGDKFPATAIQAFAPGETNENVNQSVDEMMVAAGFKQAVAFSTGSAEFRARNKIMTGFAMPDSHADVMLTVEGRPRGAWLCIDVTGRFGDDELPPNVKTGIARLRAALIDRFGEEYVATSPCYSGQ